LGRPHRSSRRRGVARGRRQRQARESASLTTVDADNEGLASAVGAGGVTLPVIVAGDFNAEDGSDAMRAQTDFGFVEQKSAVTTDIDHLFLHRTTALAVLERKVLFTGASAVSDHPGVLVRSVAAAAKPAPLTRIVALGTFATPLTVRSERAPLSSTLGWPAFEWTGAGAPSVAVVTTELAPGPFAFKFVRGDTVWQSGANVTGTGQADTVVTPVFP
jgi:hypothetical protein